MMFLGMIRPASRGLEMGIVSPMVRAYLLNLKTCRNWFGHRDVSIHALGKWMCWYLEKPLLRASCELATPDQHNLQLSAVRLV